MIVLTVFEVEVAEEVVTNKAKPVIDKAANFRTLLYTAPAGLATCDALLIVFSRAWEARILQTFPQGAFGRIPFFCDPVLQVGTS